MTIQRRTTRTCFCIKWNIVSMISWEKRDRIMPSYLVDTEVAASPLKDWLAIAGGEDHVLIGLLDLGVALHKVIFHAWIPLVSLIVMVFVHFLNITQHHVIAAIDEFHLIELDETVFDRVVVLADTIVNSLKVIKWFKSILLCEVPSHDLQHFLFISESVGLDLGNILVIIWIEIR